MKAIFMGTPQFSVHSLNCLYNMGFEIPFVITKVDKPQGRKKEIIFSPVKSRALDLGIKVNQYEKINSTQAIEEIKSAQPDVIVVSAYGQILPPQILSAAKYGCINVHASLLPKYRGASPINSAIINGETHTGITTMFMDCGLDTGDIILQDEITIEIEDDAQILTEKLASLSEKTLTNTLNLLKMDMPLPRQKQDDDMATYSTIIKKSDAMIDFSSPAENIVNLIRGMLPWPVAYTFLGDTSYKIYSAKDCLIASEKPAGTIVRLTENAIIVSTGTTDIQILKLQKAGKKKMSTSQFLKGNSLEIGSKFN